MSMLLSARSRSSLSIYESHLSAYYGCWGQVQVPCKYGLKLSDSRTNPYPSPLPYLVNVFLLTCTRSFWLVLASPPALVYARLRSLRPPALLYTRLQSLTPTCTGSCFVPACFCLCLLSARLCSFAYISAYPSACSWLSLLVSAHSTHLDSFSTHSHSFPSIWMRFWCTCTRSTHQHSLSTHSHSFYSFLLVCSCLHAFRVVLARPCSFSPVCSYITLVPAGMVRVWPLVIPGGYPRSSLALPLSQCAHRWS